jgi:erythromycin esterase
MRSSKIFHSNLYSIRMNHLLSFLISVIAINSVFCQVSESIYELNSIDDLLTKEVKEVIDQNIYNKQVVFLGEAEHHIGSDFLAKTEFVKYLVIEHKYKDIAFESDFFGLYFEHDKRNIYPHWSRSVQCMPLFDFLEENDVTLWGFDNQFLFQYTYENFTKKLAQYLEDNLIEYDANFIASVNKVIQNGRNANNMMNEKEVVDLTSELDTLLKNDKVKSNLLWHQIIENFKSATLRYTTHRKKSKGIPIRDKQMASNLNFLVKSNPTKKFIVWLANAHMSKLDETFMKGKTMGNQFIQLHPNQSYHIAVSSIKMPYRKEKWLEKSFNDKDNLLHLLPSIDKNYFIDSKKLILEYPEFEETKFTGMFNLDDTKTNWFKHFDALVFISKGEKVNYQK